MSLPSSIGLLSRMPTPLSSQFGNVDGPASSTNNALVIWDGTTGKLIKNSTATYDGTVFILPSTATSGIQLYNTVDQVTNYERLEVLWASNVARIRPAASGTGTGRGLQIITTAGSGVEFSASGIVNPNGVTLSSITSSSTSLVGWNFSNFGSTATSGTIRGLSITPTYNQSSGTAANTDLLINRTETAVGSGDQMFQEMQVGGVRRWTLGSKTVSTTDATVTTIATIPVPASTTLGVQGYVVARRTGGVSGTAEDGAYYRVETVYKNVAGTATNIGTTVTVIGESQAGWDVTVTQSSGNVLIQVTGAANNNVSWMGVFTRNPIST